MSLRRWTLLLCVPLLLAGLARAEEPLVATPGAMVSGELTCHGVGVTAEPLGTFAMAAPASPLADEPPAAKKAPVAECRFGGRIQQQVDPVALRGRSDGEEAATEAATLAEDGVVLRTQAKGVLNMLRAETELVTLLDVLAEEPTRPAGVLRIGGANPFAWTHADAQAPAYAAQAGYGTAGARPEPSYAGNPAGGAYVPYGAAHGVGIGSYLPPMPSKEIIVGGLLLGFLGLALYQRFTPAAGAQHERRAVILNTLMELPEGATAGDVGRLLGMNRKTVDYHLTYLVRLGKIRESVDETGARRYSLRALPERKPLIERTLDVVRSRPGLSVLELSETLGVSRSAADRHTKALVIQGVLESRLVDGERRLFMAAV